VLDMAGNVWEWCATQWRKSYEEPATEEPEGAASRVARGGSFGAGQGNARCAFRPCGDPDVASANLGFRVSAPIL
jgi:formylglycine-generating enzyme required for sulfatase activity